MNDLLVSFLFALGAGAWVYGKMYRRTGGITQNALAIAAGAGVVMFLAMFFLLKALFPK